MNKPQPCSVPECGNPFARLYPCGWRCDKHKPRRGEDMTSAYPKAGNTPAARADRYLDAGEKA